MPEVCTFFFNYTYTCNENRIPKRALIYQISTNVTNGNTSTHTPHTFTNIGAFVSDRSDVTLYCHPTRNTLIRWCNLWIHDVHSLDMKVCVNCIRLQECINIIICATYCRRPLQKEEQGPMLDIFGTSRNTKNV